MAGRPGGVEAPRPHPVPLDGQAARRHFEAKGKTYKGGQHGFARDVEHTLLKAEGDTIQLELRADEAIKAERFPFDFVLTSTFRLDGKTVHHTLSVRNPGTEELRFGIGYHPAFNIPFDAATPLRIMSSALTSRKARSFWTLTPTAC